MEEELKNEFINALLRLFQSRFGFMPAKDIGWKALMLLTRLELNGNVDGACEMLHISKPAVTYMLNSFENERYIFRRINRNDRRRIDIKLTGKGRKLVEVHKKTHEIFLNELLSRFGKNNTGDFIRLINRFADIIDEITEEKLNV